MTWKGERNRHSLASRGIKTKINNIKADGKRRFRKGDFIEVKEDYVFREAIMSRIGNDPVTVRKGDIGRITHTYKDSLEGMTITFKTKDGKVYFDDTDKRFTPYKFRKMKMSNPKDKAKINKIFWQEED